jgi:selenocysteine lyase/cysteine desulfurase
MYAYHLCEAAGLIPEDGVVRTSLVHYNTPEEIDRLIEVFDRALG